MNISVIVLKVCHSGFDYTCVGRLYPHSHPEYAYSCIRVVIIVTIFKMLKVVVIVELYLHVVTVTLIFSNLVQQFLSVFKKSGCTKI